MQFKDKVSGIILELPHKIQKTLNDKNHVWCGYLEGDTDFDLASYYVLHSVNPDKLLQNPEIKKALEDAVKRTPQYKKYRYEQNQIEAWARLKRHEKLFIVPILYLQNFWENLNSSIDKLFIYLFPIQPKPVDTSYQEMMNKLIRENAPETPAILDPAYTYKIIKTKRKSKKKSDAKIKSYKAARRKLSPHERKIKSLFDKGPKRKKS